MPSLVSHGPRLFVHGWALFVALTLGANAFATEVWVITDQHRPVKAGAHVRVIHLDVTAQLQAQLTRELPTDSKRAAAIVQQRLRDGGDDLQRRFAVAYQGLTDAWRLGISKIPAVVVDQRYVVYGESDVDRAVADIARYRRIHP